MSPRSPRRWPGSPSSSAIALDFDGTLAAIVDDPDRATPLPGVREVLAALVTRYRRVAVVSGRPAAFLASELPITGLERWGLYGLEHVTGAGVELVPEAAPWRSAVAAVAERARAAAPPGVGVEDKGLGLTLHTRTAPAEQEWVQRFAEREAAATGLVVHPARRSIELRPPLAVDKGTVVAHLIADPEIEFACYAGDDWGDLSAFQALDGLPSALRVAVASAEAPPELLAAADLVVDGPAGMLSLLREWAS